MQANSKKVAPIISLLAFETQFESTSHVSRSDSSFITVGVSGNFQSGIKVRTNQPKGLSRIKRELSILRQVQLSGNQSFLRVATDIDPNEKWYKFAWFEGQTFDSFLMTHPTNLKILCVLLDASRAITYMHAKRIIHGNLHPENILINFTDNCAKAMIIDCGESQSFNEVRSDRFEHIWSANQLGFSAPDQHCRDVPASALNDVISLQFIAAYGLNKRKTLWLSQSLEELKNVKHEQQDPRFHMELAKRKNEYLQNEIASQNGPFGGLWHNTSEPQNRDILNFRKFLNDELAKIVKKSPINCVSLFPFLRLHASEVSDELNSLGISTLDHIEYALRSEYFLTTPFPSNVFAKFVSENGDNLTKMCDDKEFLSEWQSQKQLNDDQDSSIEEQKESPNNKQKQNDQKENPKNETLDNEICPGLLHQNNGNLRRTFLLIQQFPPKQVIFNGVRQQQFNTMKWSEQVLLMKGIDKMNVVEGESADHMTRITS